MTKYNIVPIKTLKPLEKVFPIHLKNLAKMIEIDGIIKYPLIVDKNTGIVLDGSHRYVYFLGRGYKEIPVQFVDYNDENIRVGTHLMHRYIIEKDSGISKAEVLKRGLSGDLYHPRTTRHFFPFRKIKTIELPLYKLKRGKPIDVSNLIEKVSIDYEIKHNENFIKEIEQEIEEIIIYLEEARLTKVYLKKQIEEMKKR